jgi:4-amino-4-deoxy-L-arabinose transferase-like glycosyltransferase
MKELLKKFNLLILLSILILGFFLRSENLTTWPREGATFDEFAWTWQGINLIQTGVPKSWSPHPQYKNAQQITYRKAAFNLVTPYLEHPPVFGLVAGSYAILTGVQDMYHVTIQNMRGLALLLGMISIVLVFFLAKELYGTGIALVSALLYACIPTVVVGSRLVQNENFFIPLFLLVLFLIARFIKTKKSLLRNIAAIICGLLALSKVPFLAAALAVVGILLYFKLYKDTAKFLAIVVPIFLLFFVYGAYYDWGTFINLWKLQLARYDLTFNSIFALFTKPYLVDRGYIDGFIFWGWISFFLLLIKENRKNIILIAGVLGYLLVYLAGIPDEPGHGWYRYPFYPFLIISVAIFLKEYFAKNIFLTFLFLIFVGSSLLQLTFGAAFGFSYVVFRMSIIGWGLTLLPLVFENKKVSVVARILSFVWLVVFIALNIWAAMLYNEQ